MGLGFKFRMKTGFYEPKMYNLVIHKGKLVFEPEESDNPLITIPEEIILNATLKKSEKSLEIEVQTNEIIFCGLLINKMDYQLLIEQLKENINKKIVCEYEGGN